MARRDRHSAIERIISEKEIETQNELVDELIAAGFSVTQATVSRDINEMGLVKVAGKRKKYKYALQNSDQKINKLSTIFKESVISIDTALNMLVIKTYEGSANAACLLLDKLNMPNILGTIAGEDTILVIAKSVEAVPTIYNVLKEYI